MFTEIQIKHLESLGFRPAGLYSTNAVGLKWSEAYPDPEYRWSTTALEIKQDRYSFENVATMLGRTHIKDSVTGEYLNLNVLDTDSVTVANRLRVPIRTILHASSYDWVNDRVRDLLTAFLNESGVVNGNYEESILDILKKSGYVTKTMKEYGYHPYWLSLKQNQPIGTADCMPGREFELKTNDKYGLCTLPESTHRNDPNFRYQAIGRTDVNLVSNVLYDLFVEMFKDCLVDKKIDDNDTPKQGQEKEQEQNRKQEPEQEEQDQEKQTVLYDLSIGAIRATAAFMSAYPVRGHRHYFYVYFTGMLFHGRISLKSAFQIVSLLCDITNDEEKNNRLEILRLTYQKGQESKPLKGGPSLFKLVAQTHNEFNGKDDSVKPILGILRNIWSKDIKMYVGSDLEADKKLSEEVIEILRPDINLLFKDGKDNVFAQVNIDDSTQIVPIHKSKKFNMWVRRTYYTVSHNTLSGEVLKEVVETLESEAIFEGPIKNVELRVNIDPDDSHVIWYDLGDETWDAVRITPQGWSIVKSGDVPIMFRRYQGQLPQAIPVRDYPNDIFQQFMKLLNVKNDSDTKLIYQCYLICVLVPKIAKAIFIAHGPQGAAKTSFQDLTRSAIDPHEATNYSPPRSEDELIRQLQHNFLLFYDNLSYMPHWLSNAFCRAATGTAQTKRELYTDDDDVIYKYKRAIGFNGIALTANRADLIDRSFIIEIEALTDEIRRELEGDILPEFEKLRPQLFGFILDVLVKLLKMKEEGGIKLKAKSRMADFEVHCEMIARCLGYEDMAFVNAYRKNKKLGTNEILENNSVAMAVREFMSDRTHWKGYSSILLNELVSVATTKLKMETHKDKSWPKSPQVLSRRLKELKSSLLESGIQIFWIEDTNTNRRSINILRLDPPTQKRVQNIAGITGQPVQEDLRTKNDESTGDTGDTGDISGASKKISPVQESQSTRENGSTGDTGDTGDILQGFSGDPPNGGNWTRKGFTQMFTCDDCGLESFQFAMEEHKCPAWPEKQQQQQFTESEDES